MTWHTDQRNRFIRLTLENRGEIRTGDLIRKFEISEVTANSDLRVYAENHPEAIPGRGKLKLTNWPQVYV